MATHTGIAILLPDSEASWPTTVLIKRQCDNNSRKRCSRAQMFSNDEHTYNGLPIGNAANDNARQLNRREVHRRRILPMQGPVCVAQSCASAHTEPLPLRCFLCLEPKLRGTHLGNLCPVLCLRPHNRQFPFHLPRRPLPLCFGPMLRLTHPKQPHPPRSPRCLVLP